MLRFLIPSSASRKIISSCTLLRSPIVSSSMLLKPTQTLLMPAWMEAGLKQKKKEFQDYYDVQYGVKE